jgi:hypothetical protein
MVAAGFNDSDITNILGRSLMTYFDRVGHAAKRWTGEYLPASRGVGVATDRASSIAHRELIHPTLGRGR